MNDRFFERVDGVGGVQRIHPHHPASIGVALADPKWREVTVTPVDGLRPDSDVIKRAEQVAEEAWTRSWTDEDGYHYAPNQIVEALAAAGLLIPSDTFASMKPSDAVVAKRIAREIEYARDKCIREQEELRHYGRGVLYGLALAADIARSHATPPVAERIDSDSDWTAEQWEEWSNELASLLPPHVDGDEAQVEIVTAWVQRVALPHTRLHEGDVDAIVIAREKLISEWGDEFAEYFEENPTPPVAATEAVSGYTSHGHRIAGVVQTGRPASVARCGGPGLCGVCSREAVAATTEGADRG